MARIIANNTKTEDAQFLTECCCPLCCLCYLLFNCLFMKETFEQEAAEETEKQSSQQARECWQEYYSHGKQ